MGDVRTSVVCVPQVGQVLSVTSWSVTTGVTYMDNATMGLVRVTRDGMGNTAHSVSLFNLNPLQSRHENVLTLLPSELMTHF